MSPQTDTNDKTLDHLYLTEDINLDLNKKYKLFNSKNVLAPCEIERVNGKKVFKTLPCAGFNKLKTSKPLTNKSTNFQVMINGDYIVLDLDVDEDKDICGHDWLLENDFDIFSKEILITKTPSFGYHAWFKNSKYCKDRLEHLKKVNYLPLGIEIKDSYVLEGDGYEVKQFCDFDDLYEIPDNLVNLLIHATKTSNIKGNLIKNENTANNVIFTKEKSDAGDIVKDDTIKDFDKKLSEIKFILNNISTDRVDNYNSWFAITSIIINELGKCDESLNVWNEWSKKSKFNYDFKSNTKIWNSINRKANGRKNATLFKMLKEDDIDAFNMYQQSKKKNNKNTKSKKAEFKMPESDVSLHDRLISDPTDNAYYNQIRLYFESGFKDEQFTYETFFDFLAHRIRYFETKDCWVITETSIDHETYAFKSNYIFVKNIFVGYKSSYSDLSIRLSGDKFSDAPFSWETDVVKTKNGNEILTYGILDVYKKYLYINVFDFLPFSKVKDNVKKSNFILNSFRDRIGDKYYDENLEINESSFDKIIYHLKSIICNNDDKTFYYILRWIASIVQNPAKKTDVAIILYSLKNGSGKSTLFTILSKIINYAVSTTMDKVVTKFNSLGCEKNLICLEEIEKGATNSSVEKLKDMITRTSMSIERKGHDALTIRDCTNYIFCTNNINCLRIEENDRRYLVLDVSESRVGDFEYFDILNDNIQDNNAIKHFYNYLIRLDLSNFDLRKIPDTELKQEMKQIFRSCIDTFIEELKNEIEDPSYPVDNYEMSSTALYNKYKEFRKDNFSSEYEMGQNKFGTIMKRKFEVFKNSRNQSIYRLKTKN